MKISVVLIRIAGFLSLLFLVFHALFHRMFDWPNSLSCLDVNNRAILLTYHYISILIFSFMSVISLFQVSELLKSKVKYSVLGMFSLFFLIRIITEFTLFGIGSESLIILIVCAIPMICFALPIFIKTN
jgi:hypothetical protein